MSEPQHPHPQDPGTHEGHPAPAAARPAAQPAAQTGLDSLAAVGARLAQLREAKNWSLDDVSARLKVSSAKLRALEAGDVSQLPDTTFALGVVRSYAKMLGADPAPFTQALRRVQGVPEPDLSMPASAGTDLPRGRVSLSLGGGQKRRSWLWGIAAVVVAVIALGMWRTNGGESAAWFERLRASASGAAGEGHGASGAVAQAPVAGSTAAAVATGASAPGASDALAPQAQPAASASGAAAQSAGTAASTAQTAAPSAASAPAGVAGASSAGAASAAVAAAASAGAATITLHVSQDSWFSVRQQDGKEVFSGLVHAGDAKEISGTPPFRVTIGNKAGLDSMTYDGQPVDASKYASARGNVARFTLP
jgi:cytoskeleton protein RodZ